MKKDYKIGMLAGLIVVILIGAWLGLRGRSPRPGYAQGQPAAARQQEPSPIQPGYTQPPSPWPAGPQPTAAAAAQPAGPVAGPDPNRGIRQPLSGTTSPYGQSPLPYSQQGPPAQASAAPVAAPPVAAPAPKRTHVVREGETLSDISDRYYNTPNLWGKIVGANRSVIQDPDRIYPGTRLEIPD
ncbi:MAG: LysM peptidoglycan-binding domain-containing protein [Phycisphaerae bacterium]|nr:LysM peptidoglycan-binding domain-containing protein [Phycisphaerae bacterium]